MYTLTHVLAYITVIATNIKAFHDKLLLKLNTPDARRIPGNLIEDFSLNFKETPMHAN